MLILKRISFLLLITLFISFGFFLIYVFQTKTIFDQFGNRQIVSDYFEIGPQMQDTFKSYPAFVKVVNFAFAYPDGKGSLYWNTKVNTEELKNLIQNFQKKSNYVLLSIGGADGQTWNLDSIDIDLFTKNIKKWVDEYHFNGVDINYELLNNRDKLIILIQKLRDILPKEKYLMTYAAFAIGAYGIKGYEHPEWNNNKTKGVDISVLSVTKNLIDMVNVMTYNAFDNNIFPLYDPRESLLAYKALLGGRTDKILLGILLGKQDDPSGLIISSNTVIPWVNFVKEQGFRGVFFWKLGFDVPLETNEPKGAFADMIKNTLYTK